MTARLTDEQLADFRTAYHDQRNMIMALDEIAALQEEKKELFGDAAVLRIRLDEVTCTMTSAATQASRWRELAGVQHGAAKVADDGHATLLRLAERRAKWAERIRIAEYCESMVTFIDHGVAAPGGARAAFSSLARTLREPDPTEELQPPQAAAPLNYPAGSVATSPAAVRKAEENGAAASGGCPTCGKPYDGGPTFCSSSFHCCRDCTWSNGRRTAFCQKHAPGCPQVGCKLPMPHVHAIGGPARKEPKP